MSPFSSYFLQGSSTSAARRAWSMSARKEPPTAMLVLKILAHRWHYPALSLSLSLSFSFSSGMPPPSFFLPSQHLGLLRRKQNNWKGRRGRKEKRLPLCLFLSLSLLHIISTGVNNLFLLSLLRLQQNATVIYCERFGIASQIPFLVSSVQEEKLFPPFFPPPHCSRCRSCCLR